MQQINPSTATEHHLHLYQSAKRIHDELCWKRVAEDRKGFKYIRYDAEGEEEQLLNLNKDPYETKHFTSDLAYAEKLEYLHNEFDQEWFPGLGTQRNY